MLISCRYLFLVNSRLFWCHLDWKHLFGHFGLFCWKSCLWQSCGSIWCPSYLVVCALKSYSWQKLNALIQFASNHISQESWIVPITSLDFSNRLVYLTQAEIPIWSKSPIDYLSVPFAHIWIFWFSNQKLEIQCRLICWQPFSLILVSCLESGLTHQVWKCGSDLEVFFLMKKRLDQLLAFHAIVVVSDLTISISTFSLYSKTQIFCSNRH